jgi:hypothetical protein
MDSILLKVTSPLLEMNIFKSVHAHCVCDVKRQAFSARGCAVESPLKKSNDKNKDKRRGIVREGRGSKFTPTILTVRVKILLHGLQLLREV